MKPVSYITQTFLPVLVVIGYYGGGGYNFLLPVICFLAYPLMNLFLSRASVKRMVAEHHAPSNKNLIFLFVPLLLGLTAWSVYQAGTHSMSGIAFIGFAISVGLVNGIIGFTLAHEFIHRRNKAARFAGYLLLWQNNYMHYGIEHVRGHHVYACTPADPHTARQGESVYAFLLRTILYTYKNALLIERKRLSKKNYLYLLLHNRLWWFAVLQFMLLVTVFLLAGGKALLFFALQNSVAVILLNLVEYTQHYGLMRQTNAAGTYHRLDARHAWASGKKNNTFSVFGLENHADHHLHPGKTFDELSAMDESPEHPADYASMVLLALIPPLWFDIMNKRIPLKIKNINYEKLV